MITAYYVRCAMCDLTVPATWRWLEHREKHPIRPECSFALPGWHNTNGHTYCPKCWQRLEYERETKERLR